MIHLTVTGCVKNCPEGARRWVRSIADQDTNVHARLWTLDPSSHRAALVAGSFVGAMGYTDVVEVKDNAPLLASLLPFWRSLPDDEVIVFLDGDDWLAVPTALRTVAAAHEAGAWVTYGSFITNDGAMGFSSPSSRNARREPWRASHLKTFRAGLIKAMRDEDFRHPDGTYAGLCADLRIMFACLEMCPPGAARFIPNVLMVYNVSNSFSTNASSAARMQERAEESRIRSWTPYTPLGRLSP